MSEDKERFLSRWSRLKREARDVPAEKLEGAPEPAPQLPPLETLDFNSDFKAFLHPSVDDKLRRAALKKLFSDPHFNTMDGLDVYIDDYTKPDPIPVEMLKRLVQAQNIFGVPDAEKKEAMQSSEAGKEEAAAPALPEPSAQDAPAHPLSPSAQTVPADRPAKPQA